MAEPSLSVIKKDYIEINYNSENEWLYVNWIGTPSHESSMAGCEDILRTLAKYPVFKIINDNRNVAGSWDKGISWVIRSWLPRFMRLGYFYMAWVQSPCPESQKSLQQSLSHELPNMTILVFEDLETAAAWLKEV
ncbi:hypothetical protein HUW51_19660 [Adhaeribacter swui]|uniref:STAS/SEC14 domain-containing protein n=1 Tax=Adhaeribacter swui TaxID=2086471 RepID=A0A7G7GCF1_9BACT|nr:hypothetical protein [Adhaeribacter swui]QNF34835.1 hypothetical protein HUW51_19660 [Adhaeribacter swui]